MPIPAKTYITGKSFRLRKDSIPSGFALQCCSADTKISCIVALLSCATIIHRNSYVSCSFNVRQPRKLYFK